MQPDATPYLTSFGRRRGRKLRASKDAVLEAALPRLLIALPQEQLHPDTLFTQAGRELWFEIGFGGGEHLVEQARRNPQVNFIGCEPYVNGLATLLASIEKLECGNIRLYNDDARALLEKLPDGCIQRLFVLFPDPWPKARHHKRRIIAQPSLELFYRKLAPGGLLRIATDHVDYSVWMLEQLQLFGKFAWTAQSHLDWKQPPADWVPTRYQAKALQEGREAVFFDWVKPAY
jgi:tRNA (guanine-N7-)-methyltransferase